jgi:hypothetical protein
MEEILGLSARNLARIVRSGASTLKSNRHRPTPTLMLQIHQNNNDARIRKSKNEGSKRVLPLNDAALAAVEMMIQRADLGHKEPEEYLWCTNQHHTFDPTQPGWKWDTAWHAPRRSWSSWAALPRSAAHGRHATARSRRVRSCRRINHGNLSRRMLEHYSHIRLSAKREPWTGCWAGTGRRGRMSASQLGAATGCERRRGRAGLFELWRNSIAYITFRRSLQKCFHRRVLPRWPLI